MIKQLEMWQWHFSENIIDSFLIVLLQNAKSKTTLANLYILTNTEAITSEKSYIIAIQLIIALRQEINWFD